MRETIDAMRVIYVTLTSESDIRNTVSVTVCRGQNLGGQSTTTEATNYRNDYTP